MADADALTPRVFIIRHGETEWAKAGRATGTTDIELTAEGIQQVVSTARQLVGPGKLLDPARVVRVFVSPRKRAKQTFDHLFGAGGSGDSAIPSGNTAVTEDIAEWNYGDYEGLKAHEIKSRRSEKGLDNEREYSVWRDGCEGGESPEQVTERLDRIVAQIRDLQGPFMNGEQPADVVLVSHGLILRAFVKRWLGYPVDMGVAMMLAPGAIGILTYKNNNVNEPAFQIGMALPPAV